MKPFALTFVSGFLLVLSGAPSLAQTVTTDPVGFIPITAKGNSDTYISLPLHRNPVFQGTVSSVNGNTLTLSAAAFASNAYKDSHFALIVSGAKEGMWYTITGNAEATLALDLAGDSLGTAVSNGTVIRIIPFWTLDTLFPSGLGIKPSPTFLPQTLVLFPDQSRAGTQLAVTDAFFYYSGTSFGGAGWRKFGAPATDLAGAERLMPDSYLIVRHETAGDTTITLPGAVQMSRLANSLVTLAADTPQDNALSLNVAVPTTLTQSQLFESGVFAPSPVIDVPVDELLIFDNDAVQQNKQPAIYYYYSGSANNGPGWRLKGNLSDIQDGNQVFLPGKGYIVRKAASSQPSAAVWTVRPSYVPQ